MVVARYRVILLRCGLKRIHRGLYCTFSCFFLNVVLPIHVLHLHSVPQRGLTLAYVCTVLSGTVLSGFIIYYPVG